MKSVLDRVGKKVSPEDRIELGLKKWDLVDSEQ